MTFGSSALSPDDTLFRAFDWMKIEADTEHEKMYSVDVSVDSATALGVFIIPKTGTSGPVGIARKVNGVWNYKFDGVIVPSGVSVSAAFYTDWADSSHVDDIDVPVSTLGSTTEYIWSNQD